MRSRIIPAHFGEISMSTQNLSTTAQLSSDHSYVGGTESTPLCYSTCWWSNKLQH